MTFAPMASHQELQTGRRTRTPGRTRCLSVLVTTVLLTGILSSPATAQGHTSPPCQGKIDITRLAFSPASARPGRSSTVHLAARSCLDVTQNTVLTLVGRFTGKHAQGCPIIDPLARPMAFPPHGVITSKTGYDLPASCTATGLRVTARFAGSTGQRLVAKSASLAIT
jgi:hypothetical protein